MARPRPPKKTPATPAGHESASGPTFAEIEQAAYERYLQRGGEHGLAAEDWLEAERELRSRR